MNPNILNLLGFVPHPNLRRTTQNPKIIFLAGRKAAEEKLRERHSTLRSIIDSANALIFSVDRQYCYTCFNPGHAAVMKAICGAEIEHGRSILEYMTVPEDREIARRNLDRAFAGEQLTEEAYSGEELRSRQYFQVSHSPISTEEEIIGAAVLARDITGRKRAEMQLLRLNRIYAVLSSINQTIVRVRGTGELSNEACRIAVECGKFRMAWIGMVNSQTNKVDVVASYGVSGDYLEKINIDLNDELRRNGPAETAVITGKHKISNNIRQDSGFTSVLTRGYGHGKMSGFFRRSADDSKMR